MILFETKTQFIIKEEGVENTNRHPEYDIRFPTDMSRHCKVEFPRFELICKTGGRIEWKNYFKLCYRGFDFEPKYEGEKENFILTLLNDLKRGDYQTKICTLIENSIKKEDFDRVKGMLKSPNIKADMLIDEIEGLRSEIDVFQKKLNEIESTRNENHELRSKLGKITSIIDE